MAWPTGTGGLPAQSDPETETPYTRWIRTEGLDALDSSLPTDLRAVALKPWARRGGRAVFLQCSDRPVATDCYVCEIPPGLSLAPQRHLFEEMVLVLAGRGSTTFRTDRGANHSFEWQAGTLFTVPLNATYQHFNGSGSQCARFVAVTTAPAIINAFDDLDFVFGCRHDFGDRALETCETGIARTIDFDGACGLDALDCPLMADEECGVGGHLRSRMGTRGLSVLISQLPPATYGKARACGSDAYTIVLAGEGYSLVWTEGGQRTCWRWRQGSLLAAPTACWQQHFNSCRAPARLVTLAPELGLPRYRSGVPQAGVGMALGGACIDYADEAADIRAAFAVALAENGLESRMPAMDAAESGGA